jgi:hypothetical protein
MIQSSLMEAWRGRVTMYGDAFGDVLDGEDLGGGVEVVDLLTDRPAVVLHQLRGDTAGFQDTDADVALVTSRRRASHRALTAHRRRRTPVERPVHRYWDRHRAAHG